MFAAASITDYRIRKVGSSQVCKYLQSIIILVVFQILHIYFQLMEIKSFKQTQLLYTTQMS